MKQDEKDPLDMQDSHVEDCTLVDRDYPSIWYS